MDADATLAGSTLVSITDAASDPGWDAFLDGVPGGDLVQTTGWAATKTALGLRSDLAIVSNDEGACVGGGLLITKRLAPGLAVSYVARGPIALPQAPWASVLALDALINRARSLHARYLIVQPPEGADHLDRELQMRAFQPGAPVVAPDATVRLDLTRADDELLLGMSDMRRRNVRRAARDGIDVAPSSDLAMFHRLHTATAVRQGFEPLSLAYLEHQWEHLHARGVLTLLAASQRGTALAAIWVTNFNGIATFKLAGWDASAPGPKHVNELLHWKAAQWARDNGALAYDFGGIERDVAELLLRGEPVPDAVRASYSFFKLGFSRSPVVLPPPRYLLPSRLARFALEKTRLLDGRAGQRLADRFRNG